MSKDATTSRLASDRQIAAEQPREATTDRKSEARAAKSSSNRGICLHERIEDLVERVRCNIDARIDYVDND